MLRDFSSPINWILFVFQPDTTISQMLCHNLYRNLSGIFKYKFFINSQQKYIQLIYVSKFYRYFSLPKLLIIFHYSKK